MATWCTQSSTGATASSRAEPPGSRGSARTRRVRAGSALGDVRGLRPLRPLGHLEGDLVPLLECPESVPHDRAVVDEHVGTARALDEAETLRLVEPFHLSCFRPSAQPPLFRARARPEAA